ncbi:MAG: hypothetical protein HPY55_15590 [Firmicutes bacterium]|nr:hypothetical protein [Bacillota bacterium]
MRYPFEVPFSELETNVQDFVSVVFSSLESEFLVMPKGEGFINYPSFEKAYEVLKRATRGFESVETESIMLVAVEEPLTLIVLRTILGLTSSEWAYVASQRSDHHITQGWARSFDRNVRMAPFSPLPGGEKTLKRVRTLVDTACQMLQEPVEDVGPNKIHRFDKADTREGSTGLRNLSSLGVPYSMLLYERLLGRPFAGHRDSVSELVGDNLEVAIEDELAKAGITYRKTKRVERIPGFDQSPDFIIPTEFNPQVVIEAKVTEDDGTARDKVTRIQHLASLRRLPGNEGSPTFEVVACIAGRGFGERREDMKKLLLATHGKVFTPRTLHRLVECTRLREFKTK